MTQEEFGRRVGLLLGKVWSRSTVSVAEKGGRAWTGDEIFAASEVLDTRPARLLVSPMAGGLELASGATLGTSGLADFGIADDSLSKLWEALDQARRSNDVGGRALKSALDQVTTLIASSEMSSMHSDRGSPALGESPLNPPPAPEGEQ
jgi:hypothetical protein